MSYILDALRKADAQRARDSVRGINAQGGRGLPDASTPSRFRPWYWAAGVVVVAAAAWGGWSLQQRPAAAKHVQQDTEEVIVPPRVIAADASRPAVSEPPNAAPMAPAFGTRAQPAPVVVPPPSAAQVAQAQAAPPPGWPPTGIDPRNTARPMIRGNQQQPGSTPVPMPQPAGTAAAPMQAPVQQPPGMEPPAMPTPQPGAQASQPAPVPYSPPVPANAPPPPPVAGLPADAPKLSISGGVYSANRAQRMLIVNGQVFSEGSEISSGVVLEEVKPKIAVLRFRGARYTVTY